MSSDPLEPLPLPTGALNVRGMPLLSGSQLIDQGLSPVDPAAVDLRDSLTPAEALGLTPARILLELGRIALADIGQAFDAEGRLLPLHEMPEDVRRAIAAIEVEEIFTGRGEDRVFVGVLRKVKFWNKDKALQTIATHLGMLVEVRRIEMDGDLADLIRDARQRAAQARLTAVPITPTQET